MSAHTHRWRIETPDGPESPGVCQGCGETKLFPNSHWLDRQDAVLSPAMRAERQRGEGVRTLGLADDPPDLVACPECSRGIRRPHLAAHRRRRHGTAA